jgi:hypothetical protein
MVPRGAIHSVIQAGIASSFFIVFLLMAAAMAKKKSAEQSRQFKFIPHIAPIPIIHRGHQSRLMPMAYR